jgi:hypothetical protein
MLSYSVGHNLPAKMVELCQQDGRVLVFTAMHYLKDLVEPYKDVDTGLTIFKVRGERCLVRLTKGASCTKGIGREGVIKKPKFDDAFDYYLAPMCTDKHFTFAFVDK